MPLPVKFIGTGLCHASLSDFNFNPSQYYKTISLQSLVLLPAAGNGQVVTGQLHFWRDSNKEYIANGFDSREINQWGGYANVCFKLRQVTVQPIQWRVMQVYVCIIAWKGYYLASVRTQYNISSYYDLAIMAKHVHWAIFKCSTKWKVCVHVHMYNIVGFFNWKWHKLCKVAK